MTKKLVLAIVLCVVLLATSAVGQYIPFDDPATRQRDRDQQIYEKSIKQYLVSWYALHGANGPRWVDSALYAVSFAGSWPWWDSSGNNIPGMVDSATGAERAEYADSATGAEYAEYADSATEIDTTSAGFTTYVTNQTGAVVSRDSIWAGYAKVEGGDDSVRIVPERLMISSDQDSQFVIVFDNHWVSFTLDAAGDLTITPSGGDADVLGTFNADSMDIDGGVQIDGRMRIVAGVNDLLNLVSDPGVDSVSFTTDANGYLEIFTSGGSVYTASDIAIKEGGTFYTFNSDNTATTAYYTTDYFSIITSSLALYVHSEQDSIILDDNTYITGDLKLDGTFNKIRCGELWAADLDTCTGGGYRYFVTVDPVFADTNYTVSLTVRGGGYLAYVVDSARTASGFWIATADASMIEWIATKQ